MASISPVKASVAIIVQYMLSTNTICKAFRQNADKYSRSYILEQNALIENGKLLGAQEIDLRAVLIGNGWMDPSLQYASLYNFTVDPGNTYDVEVLTTEAREAYYNGLWGPNNCLDQIEQCHQTGRDDVCSAASSWCSGIVETDSGMLRNRYDLRSPLNDTDPPRPACDIYMNRPEIQEALGVVTNFTWLSWVVDLNSFPNTGSDLARYEGVIDDLRNLTNSGVYIAQYHGDADVTCNWYGGEAVMHEINAPGINMAGYQNFTSMQDATVRGQVKQSANYAFVRVYESGHEVPYYQPVIALEMLNRTLQGLDLATGKIPIKMGSGYRTAGPLTSDYREGNSTVH